LGCIRHRLCRSFKLVWRHLVHDGIEVALKVWRDASQLLHFFLGGFSCLIIGLASFANCLLRIVEFVHFELQVLDTLRCFCFEFGCQ
jgi:hypothetical protein